MRIKIWLQELRAPFFTASVVPVFLGTAVAWHALGMFDLTYFLLTLLGGILLHAGANVANDYYDYKNRSDNINKEYIRPFTGGSRMIQSGIMTPREVLTESAVCFFLAALIGCWLTYRLGWIILFFGIIGAFSGFFYSAPPLKLVSRGVGELLIGLNFGVLMTLGTYFVQTGHIGWAPLLASLPVALLITSVLYINEFPDYNADREAGKLHLVARMGRRRAAAGYIALITATYMAINAGVLLRAVPPLGLATLVTLPLAIKASKVTNSHFDHPKRMVAANKATIQLHLAIGLILSASYIISGLL